MENIRHEKCVHMKLLRCVPEAVKLQRVLREAGESKGVVVCKGEAEPRETGRKDSELKSAGNPESAAPHKEPAKGWQSQTGNESRQEELQPHLNRVQSSSKGTHTKLLQRALKTKKQDGAVENQV